MAATSVGEIGLDLVVNKGQFNKQMRGIESLASKAGKALAGAFAVTKLVQFGAKCVELGSDLQEVQNVVDVTFPKMSAKVDSFAQKAASSFGMSETMAKKFTGTYGAMAKSFGFAEGQAYQMSTSLTQLAGDVASFYNLSQDEAYTKLKSVFTGETESLKDLGVVMTQTALDAYALENGFGKITKAMTEQEKVALRYAFVQDKLSAASGDFARTSGGWANQVRVLKLQMESFMATVGQGFINLFTPVIRVVNAIIGKLISLANAFKAFTELITGKKSDSSQPNAIANTGDVAAASMDNATASANNLTNATNSVGKAAENTAKKMRQIMGFDAINKLNDNSDASAGTSGTGGAGGGTGSTYDFGTLEDGETVLDTTASKFQKIIDKAKELALLFQTGFELGLGDTEANLQRIQQACNNIAASFRNIFTDSKVASAAEELADSIALNLGKITGSVVNIGVAIATNLTEGIARSLEEQKGFIKEKLANILKIEAKLINVVGDFGTAIGDIVSTALTSDVAVQITSDITSFITNAFLNAFELAQKVKLDIASMILTPITENKEKIKTAINNTLEPMSTAITTLKDAFANTFEKIGEFYDEHLHPLFDAIKIGISDSLGKLLDVYNESVAPVLNRLSIKFKEVFEENINPAIEKIVKAFGPLIDIIGTLYEEKLKPFVDWCIENIVPVVAKAFETFGTIALEAVGDIADIVGNLSESIGRLFKFVDGALSGDWKKAWEGLKETAQGVWNTVSKILGVPNVKLTFKGIIDKTFKKGKEAYEKIKNSTALKTLKSALHNKWKSVKKTWDKLKGKTITKTLRSAFHKKWNSRKKIWNNLKSASITKTMKAKLSSTLTRFKKTWDSLKDKTLTIKANVSAAITNIKNLVNDKIIAKLNGAITTLNKLPGINIPKIPKLASGGYVKRNTPQLAVIGDNMRYGEVVAPEDKLEQMALKAAQLVSGGAGNAEILSLLREILVILKSINIVGIDEEALRKYFISKTNANTKRDGKCELIT